MRTKSIRLLTAILSFCLAFAMVVFFGNAKSANAEVKNIEIAGQTIDISSFETYAGASIRYDKENKGIRFVTGISEDAYGAIETLVSENEGYSVTYGTIVTYSYRVQRLLYAGYDFTKVDLDEYVQTNGSKYVDFSVLAFREKPEVAGNVEFTAVLGINETNYAIPMSARGYMVISDGETEQIFYANYKVLNSTAENVSHKLLEDFITYGVDNDTKLQAIAEYTKNETTDGYYMPNASSMIPYTNNSEDVSLETNQSIGGRSGVTKYTMKTAGKGWSVRLMPAFTGNIPWTGSSTAWHQNSVNRQQAMGFKYVVFDIYLQDSFSIYFPTSSGVHAYVKVSASGDLVYRYNAQNTTDTEITEKVKIFNAGGTQQLSATYSGIWYTVVIDISCNLSLESNSACDTSISFDNANSVVYFDNVRFYRTNAWEQDIVVGSMEMDASEFGILRTGEKSTDVIYNTNATISGRSGVINFGEGKGDSNVSGSYTRFGFKFSDMWDDAGTATAWVTNKRMLASGVKYISFDVCRGGGSSFKLGLWDGDSYPTFSVNASTGAVDTAKTGEVENAQNVRIYLNGEQQTEIVKNTWYTIIIEVKVDAGSQWSAINWCQNYENIAIDNIVYYYNDVPALWPNAN